MLEFFVFLLVLFCVGLFVRGVFDPVLDEQSKPGHTCKIILYKNLSMKREGMWDCEECRRKLRKHVPPLDKNITIEIKEKK